MQNLYFMLKRSDCIDRAWRSVLTGFRSFLLPSKVSIVTSPCFQISVHTSRWLHRNFETKLARCTASCNQWILSDLVRNYIACYQHKAATETKGGSMNRHRMVHAKIVSKPSQHLLLSFPSVSFLTYKYFDKRIKKLRRLLLTTDSKV